MDQQNQEIITGDSSSTPPKRKRGRPRKYDNVSSESGSPSPRGSSPRGSSPRGSSSSIKRLQNIPPQSYLAAAGHGIQVTPMQANLTYSSLRPHSLQFQTNTSSSPICGVQPEAVPAPAQRTASSSHHSAIIPTLANSSDTSRQGPTSLLGLAVSGTLDGTFDAGYLLTVQVPETGLVLKGVVFDPQRSVPISREIDIAPFLPMATSSVISPSVLQQPSQTLVPVPIHPVSMVSTAAVPLQMKEPAASSQSGRQLFATPGLPQNATLISKNEKAPKVTKIGPKSLVNNANQESTSGAPHKEVIKDAQSVDSLAVAAVNKDKSQVTMNLPAEGQSTNVVEPAGGRQNMCQVEESLAKTSVGGNMVEFPRIDVGQVESVGGEPSTHQVAVIETSAKDAGIHVTETSIGDNMVEITGGAEGKVESLGGEQSVHQVEESTVHVVQASGKDADMHQTETSTGSHVVEVPGGDEARINSVAREQSAHQVNESSVNIVGTTSENAEMQQAGTPSGRMVEVPGGTEGQHCPQEPLQSNSQKPSGQMSDKNQFCGEQKLEDGETKLQDSSVLQEPTF